MELFGNREDNGLKIGLAKLQTIHMGTDDIEFLHLLGAHQAVNSSLYLFRRRLATAVNVLGDIKIAVGMQ